MSADAREPRADALGHDALGHEVLERELRADARHERRVLGVGLVGAAVTAVVVALLGLLR